MSERAIDISLKAAEDHLREALEIFMDESTEYLEEDLYKTLANIQELRNKLQRDAILEKDREAFAEPGGLGEWVNGG
jgi:hypothetical protein